MKIVPSMALRKVFRNMGPGFGSLAKSKEDYALHALAGIDRKDAEELRWQIDSLLASLSPEELRIWWQNVAFTTYFQRSADVVEFLTVMRSILGKPPYLVG